MCDFRRTPSHRRVIVISSSHIESGWYQLGYQNHRLKDNSSEPMFFCQCVILNTSMFMFRSLKNFIFLSPFEKRPKKKSLLTWIYLNCYFSLTWGSWKNYSLCLSVCDRHSNQTVWSNLAKFGTHIVWCIISVNFFNGQHHLNYLKMVANWNI